MKRSPTAMPDSTLKSASGRAEVTRTRKAVATVVTVVAVAAAVGAAVSAAAEGRVITARAVLPPEAVKAAVVADKGGQRA